MNFQTFFVLLSKEIKEYLKTKKLLILAIVFLFVAISSPIVAKIIPGLLSGKEMNGIVITIPTATAKDALDQFAKNISQLAILVLIFLVSGSIAGEKSNKTLELVLSKPVSRSSLILAKFAANKIALLTVYIVSGIIFYFYTASILGKLNFGFFILFLILSFAYLFVIESLTIFASTFVNNLGAVGIGFAGIIAFSLFDTLVKDWAKYSPYYFLGQYKEIVASGWNNQYIIPLIVAAILIACFIYFSTAIFKHQEIER